MCPSWSRSVDDVPLSSLPDLAVTRTRAATPPCRVIVRCGEIQVSLPPYPPAPCGSPHPTTPLSSHYWTCCCSTKPDTLVTSGGLSQRFAQFLRTSWALVPCPALASKLPIDHSCSLIKPLTYFNYVKETSYNVKEL